MRFGTSLFAALLALVLLVPGSAMAAESFDSCKGFITSLPAKITTSGTWCLKQNLSTLAATGTGITVAANDVTLDCNGFSLDNSAAGAATRTAAIRAHNLSGVTVRNCKIRGFQFGIYLTGTTGLHLIEDNHLDSNTFAGIWVTGDGSILRRNVVLDTGGSTATTRAFGIYSSQSADLIDNTVAGVFAGSGDTFGIRTDGNAAGSIAHNRIRGVARSSAGVARGIHNYNSGRITVADNNVSGNGSAGSQGIVCSGPSGRAKNNVVVGFPASIYLCANAGGNDTSP